MQKCLTLGKNLGMLPSLAKVEQRVAGRPRAKFSENVFILRGERRRNYIRYFKVCAFEQRVNYSVDENSPKKKSQLWWPANTTKHQYLAESPQLPLPIYPKDPRNAIKWDLIFSRKVGVIPHSARPSAMPASISDSKVPTLRTVQCRYSGPSGDLVSRSGPSRAGP